MNKSYLKSILFAVGVLMVAAVSAVLLIKKTKDLPNIVLIVMDTARQDRLSSYGYKRDTSPNLTELIKSSRVYYNAYANGGWTISSHASLFTGLFSIAHKTTQENMIMDPGLTTLAEVLSDNGYETTGIIANVMLRSQRNFNKGFKDYHEVWKKAYHDMETEAKEHICYLLFEKTIQKKEEPFFLFLNFVEPHVPYNSSRQFYDTFVSDPSIDVENSVWFKYFLNKNLFPPEELIHMGELYDAELLYVDYLVGKIISSLKKNKLWDNTIFIVTSDHGENLGEHEMVDHVFSLYEPIIKIPLIIHYPKLFSPGSKDYDPAQLIDIFPTLLKIAGIDTGSYPSHGSDLLGKSSREKNDIFSEYSYPRQCLDTFKAKDRDNPKLDKYKRYIKTVISKNMKLIWGSDGNHELYDLAKDPNENENLIDQAAYSNTKQDMIKKINVFKDKYKNKIIGSSAPTKKEKLDKETLKEMKALGYIQ